MKKYFLCMVALLSLAIVACESDDTAPAPTVRPTFDLIDAQPDVTSAVVAANIESKGEVPISEVGFSYQEAGGEYVDVVCTNFKDGLARQTLTGLTDKVGELQGKIEQFSAEVPGQRPGALGGDDTPTAY